MGNSTSTPEPPKRLTDRPWREPSNWSDELQSKIMSDIKKLSPPEKPSLLFLGPVGSGKSSFINAVLSIGKNRKVDMAQTGSGAKSFTTSYDRYTNKTLMNNYRLRDCMGIEQSENEGFHVDDIVYLLKGHVMDGYKFNPRSPITTSSAQYRASPKLENQTHCVVFVVDSNSMHQGIPPNYVKKIAELQERIKQLRIPRVLILTKVDKLCSEVRSDVSKMFRSVKVEEAVKLASEVFNIPQASIHPVKNYEVDYEINVEQNIPILLALRQMMQYADDRLEKVLESDDSD